MQDGKNGRNKSGGIIGFFAGIGAVIYSFLFEPIQAIFSGQGMTGMMIIISAGATGLMFWRDQGSGMVYVWAFLSALICYAVLAVWIDDPFVLILYRILELGWLLFLIPAIVFGGIAYKYPAFSMPLFFACCAIYLISAVLRVKINLDGYYAKKEEYDEKASQSRETGRDGRTRDSYTGTGSKENVSGGGGTNGFVGIFNGLSKAEAKSKYARLLKEYHPDNGGDPEMAKEIISEYRLFRKRYSGKGTTW